MTLQVAIAGAGIGGLAAARALAIHGIAATVYEQATAIGEVGAAVQLSPNAVRVLAALGAWEVLDGHATRPSATILRHYRSGEVIARRPLGADAEARYGYPYAQVLRADLHRALAGLLDPSMIVLGKRTIDVAHDDATATLVFADGDTAPADVVIGADGVRSSVRGALFEPQAPVFRGEVAFRGLAPTEYLRDIEAAGVVWLGPERHFVAYPVAGGRIVNCVGIVRADHWREESWSAPAGVDEWHDAFAGWDPRIHDLIGAIPEAFKWALYDREPLADWSIGRATLLGDAAHPMLPSMSQGAAQSLEDAWVVAACLATEADPVAALARYADLRRPRATRVQLQSRENQRLAFLPFDSSPEQLRTALGREAVGGDALFDWLYGYDALAAAA